MPLTPLLSAHWDEPDSHTIDGYRRHGGYESVPVALGMQPDEVVRWSRTRDFVVVVEQAFPPG